MTAETASAPETAQIPTLDGAPAAPDRDALADRSVALVRTWLAEAAQHPADPSAERLAGVLKDENGLDFTIGFVDRVVRPEDLPVAGNSLAALTAKTPGFLPWYMQGAIRAGGILGPVLPQVVVPVARRVLREMVGHLIVDATSEKLGPAIAKLREGGSRLNLNLLGEAVLGEKEAARRLAGTRELLARDDVDYVSIKVSSVVSQLSMWAFDEAVDKVVERLTPLYELASKAATPKFINLDMEEYKDLDLTIEVFTRVLDQPQLKDLEAGIVLQAYLPDALAGLQRLTAWAQERRAAGGAPIKVRIVKGANLAMEQVDGRMHDWPVATWATKEQTDTHYKRMLEHALAPAAADAVKVGVAGHNLFDVAYAWLLAEERGVTDRIEFEMLLGMATGQAEAVKRTVGGLLLYTPVVHPTEFDVAISYLIRRLEENASQENFMSAVFELSTSSELFAREESRFRASLAGVDDAIPAPNRTQDRRFPPELDDVDPLAEPETPEEPEEEVDPQLTSVVMGFTRGSLLTPDALVDPDASATPFHNAADTDPALPTNRAWGREILARVEASQLGVATIEAARIDSTDQLDDLIDGVRTAAASWGGRPGDQRAALLHRVGVAIERNRARLIEVMASETGKTIAEADPEVSEAVDFAHYYAERARDLDRVQGARFVPSRVTVVAPPWNFPVAIPAGSMLAALASGSGVVVKPAGQARRSGAVLVEALREAGVPRELLALVDAGEAEFGEHLISHPVVDRVILTGGYETAEVFRSWKSDLPLLAETSGKNAIIVTPSADLDLAAADVVKSAFGHAGQKCSAASLVILVGSVGRSRRFLTQLTDAVSSLRVGYPSDPTTQMGPIIEPAAGKLKHALTQLGVGEKWLVEPEAKDETGRLWSPGVRDGVKPGSYFHLTEFFGPVLGVMRARTLEEAIRFQNAIPYGLTAGLHSLDARELEQWLETVEAGNLYVNRGITGAIVQRQPFGGWKRSSVGSGTKAGGPNYLMGLGSWVSDEGRHSSSLHLRGLAPRVTELIESAQPAIRYEDFDLVRRSALSDAVAWHEEFGQVKDPSGLGVERNLFRYRPLPVTVRLTESGALADLLRVLAAGRLARAEMHVSVPGILPAGLGQVLEDLPSVHVTIETDAAWLARVAASGIPTERVRLVAARDARLVEARALSDALRGTPDVAVFADEVTAAGRVEMLTFLREQAISITAHRFGNPDDWSEAVI
ncbi:aldehyde dehydrogenase family protein [Clavibacter michiganensis]|nr:aldehyde dehydrogenase family protein [Clavibacter michiganensis]